jgi:hypothetical protein
VEVPLAKPVAPSGSAAPAANGATTAPAAPKTTTPSYRVPEPAANVPETEEDLRTVHLSMFRHYPWRCLGYLALVAAGIVGMIWLLFYDRQWLALLCAAVALYGVLRLGLWGLRMGQTSLKITNKRSILTRGLFNRESIEFDHDHIADLHVHQSTLMRWLDVADIAIVRTDPQQQQIVIMAVPHPKDVTDLLQAQLDARRKTEIPASGAGLKPGTVVTAPGPVEVK